MNVRSLRILMPLLLLASSMCALWGANANDEAQANGHDQPWQGAWVAHAHGLLATAHGKRAGFVLMVGDSITHFTYNAIWPSQGRGQAADDQAVLSWCHAREAGSGSRDVGSVNGWYLSTANTSGNRGMTASAGIDSAQLLSGSGLRGPTMPQGAPGAPARGIVADGTDYPFNLRASTLVNAFSSAQFAVCEIGTNDVNTARTPTAYITNVASLVGLLEAQHIVPILCTLPPRPDSYTNGLVRGYNQALYSYARSHGLALIDVNAEILARRPGTSWEGTLIIAGDVHPTHSGAGYDCTSDPYANGGNVARHATGAACTEVGFLLRSWLIVQKLKQVKSLVVDAPTTTGPGSNAWLGYGHDSQRTSVCDGRARPPYSLLWEYRPQPPSGRRLLFLTHVIASASTLFVGWAGDDQLDGYDAFSTGSIGMDALTADGHRQWSYDSLETQSSGTRNLAHWPVASQAFVWEIDDGQFCWPYGSPTRVKATSGLDASALWGDVAWQNNRLYGVNGFHANGRGLELACWNEDGSSAWSSVMTFAGSRANDVSDSTQGLAVDGSLLVYAPQYRFVPGQAPPFGTGLYGFDATTGAPGFVAGCNPLSKISASAGQIYLLESENSLQYLSARRETTGQELWRVQVTNGSRQAPVVFADQVVAASAGGVTAYRLSDGGVLWTSAIPDATVPDDTLSMAPAPSVPTWSPVVHAASVNGMPTFQVRPTTTIAGCSYGQGSATISSLVVVSGDTITTLDAATGARLGSFTPAGPAGPVASVRDPIIVGNRLYVVTDQNAVLAYAGQ